MATGSGAPRKGKKKVSRKKTSKKTRKNTSTSLSTDDVKGAVRELVHRAGFWMAATKNSVPSMAGTEVDVSFLSKQVRDLVAKSTERAKRKVELDFAFVYARLVEVLTAYSDSWGGASAQERSELAEKATDAIERFLNCVPLAVRRAPNDGQIQRILTAVRFKGTTPGDQANIIARAAGHLLKPRWDALDPKQRKAWDSIPKHARASLGGRGQAGSAVDAETHDTHDSFGLTLPVFEAVELVLEAFDTPPDLKRRYRQVHDDWQKARSRRSCTMHDPSTGDCAVPQSVKLVRISG